MTILRRPFFWIIAAVIAVFVAAPTIGNDIELRESLLLAAVYITLASNINLILGYAGYVNFGSIVFFGLGGYCMAMFLKLESSSVANTKIQSTPGIPDFMDWNQIHALPAFWKPFHSLTFSLIAVIAVPTIVAFVVGVAMFKRRVGGVYFAIITQAIAAVLTILIGVWMLS